MQIDKIINKKYLDINYQKISNEYKNQKPFPKTVQFDMYDLSREKWEKNK